MSVLALMWLLASPAAAGDGAGTSVAPILRLGPGARPASLAESYVSVAEGADAAAWNPAGLAFLDGPEASFMYLRLFQKIHYNYAAFGMPWRDRFGFGGHLVYAKTDSAPRTFEDPGGNFDSARSGGSFSDSDMKLGLSGAYKVASWFSAGAGLSFFRDTVDASSANGLLFDLAALAKPEGRFRYGAALQNLGGNHGGTAPSQLRLGAAFQWSPEGLVSTELQRPFDSGKPSLALGTEYRFVPSLAGRLGYRVGNAGDAGGNRWSVGLGLRHGSWDFDFAVVPYGDLGLSERISIGYAFGRAPEHTQPVRAITPASARAVRAPKSGPDPMALIEDADHLVARRKWEQAGRAWVQAGSALPAGDERQVHVLERIGLVSLELGRLGQARDAYTRALQKASELGVLPSAVADAYAGMGRVLAKEGKAPYARKFFEKALEASPSAETRDDVERRLRALERK